LQFINPFEIRHLVNNDSKYTGNRQQTSSPWAVTQKLGYRNVWGNVPGECMGQTVLRNVWGKCLGVENVHMKKYPGKCADHHAG